MVTEQHVDVLLTLLETVPESEDKNAVRELILILHSALQLKREFEVVSRLLSEEDEEEFTETVEALFSAAAGVAGTEGPTGLPLTQEQATLFRSVFVLAKASCITDEAETEIDKLEEHVFQHAVIG